MTAQPFDTDDVFGFISVIQSAEHGLFGGYLIVNGLGRPLEFHCTAPVQANRAQEILYGTTLEPFLYGEQIGQTLLSAAKRSPGVVCTDVLPVLALQSLTSVPVAWVADRLPEEGLTAPGSVDLLKLVQETQSPRLSTLGTVHPFVFADHVLLVLESMREQQADICERLLPLMELIELREPFLRIKEAIEEAHRTALGEPRLRQAG
ncbi:MAG: hypothetical protein OSB47_10275 [Pirellulaceae bacterium]|nr:hypothetical protein [Pirellulaceae bacterium]